jgi:pseudouridine synthase
MERLQKLMAQAGLGSRRANEALIAAGRVRVNGRVAKLGDKADPAQDRIEVDGRALATTPAGPIYIALNKPRGVISSLEDELDEGRPTVRDLIGIAGHIYPVGRLDKPSEGLMIMTNDGELAHRLTHPRFGHEKAYDVTVEGTLTDAVLDRWRAGVVLDGRPTVPATIEVTERGPDYTRLTVILREGRKRQIRRIAAELGHPVLRLVRRRIGPILLGDLQPGAWRYLTAGEIDALVSVARAKNPPGHRRPQKRNRQLPKASPDSLNPKQ